MTEHDRDVPTEGDVFLRIAAVFALVGLALAVLAGWALQ